MRLLCFGTAVVQYVLSMCYFSLEAVVMHMSCRHSWLLVNSRTVSAIMTAKVNKQATYLRFRPGTETLVLFMARHTYNLLTSHMHIYVCIYIYVTYSIHLLTLFSSQKEVVGSFSCTFAGFFANRSLLFCAL